MRFGPTSLKSSSVLAKGLRRPKFRTDARISEQTIAGEKSYVVKVPETNSYNRYGVSEFGLLTLCDGTRTGSEIAALWNEQHPDDPYAEAEVLEFLDGIEAGVWEQSAGEKNLAVLERIRDDRKGRIDQSSALYITFKAWDPNTTLAKMDPYFSWMFTRGFVYFSVALFVASVYLLAGDWAQVQRDTAALYTFQGKTAYDIWVFWFLLLGLGGIHELGHGLTCKHFGGDVHQMGLLLIYFTPAFYTDTTDIVLFDKTARRQWVLFAGIWIELVICGIATFFWRFTAAGSFANDLAYKTMLLSGIQGALLNLNPLIKADGYYALSQFLNIDNLREDAFAFLRALARRQILRDDLELPTATRRQRRIYVVFGIAALIYSVTLVVLVVLFVRNVFVSKFGNWGYVLTVGVVYYFARKGLKKVLSASACLVARKERGIHGLENVAEAAGGRARGLPIVPDPADSNEGRVRFGSGTGQECARTARGLRFRAPGVREARRYRQRRAIACRPRQSRCRGRGAHSRSAACPGQSRRSIGGGAVGPGQGRSRDPGTGKASTGAERRARKG